MKRRKFLKTAAAAGSVVAIPSSLTLQSLLSPAYAAPDFNQLDYTAPAVMPQVINIFLYGGPSELAGNLTNIVDIDRDSQNPYPNELVDRANGTFGQGVTANGFWANAGGNSMEFLLGSPASANPDPYMTIYRTMMKRKNTTRSHRENIFMGLKGSLDIENTPGIGTRLATMLYLQRNAINGTTQLADGEVIAGGGLYGPLETLFLPFVSFEGESTAFANDPMNAIPLGMRGTTLDTNFNNPYTRQGGVRGTELDALVAKVQALYSSSKYQKAINGFELRQALADQLQRLSDALNDNLAPLPTMDQQPDIDDNNANAQVAYPNNSFGQRVRAAVTLAIENPSSLYITVGGGLGGWDDHNNGFDRYPGRMANVMATMRAAIKHIKYSGTQTPNVVSTPAGLARATDNIVINMFGDFGRLVNRNNSNGWDHANNQNLYSFGGAAVIGVDASGTRTARQLGKIVGTTGKSGNPGQNNQFTVPTGSSYEFEPLSVGATVYGYFGANNPQVLNQDAMDNPGGDPAVDESVASEALT